MGRREELLDFSLAIDVDLGKLTQLDRETNERLLEEGMLFRRVVRD